MKNMRLQDILKNDYKPKSIGNSGYYGLYNTFEKLKKNKFNQKQLEKYASYMVKHIEGYTPKDLIYFIGERLEKVNSDAERKILSVYNKAAWNNLAEKYGMQKFFESGKISYPKMAYNYLSKVSEKILKSMHNAIDHYAYKGKDDTSYTEVEYK
ncbi:MAG: hypothetical protein QXL94_06770 [Candidatus Parvarchaeum sp.]